MSVLQTLSLCTDFVHDLSRDTPLSDNERTLAMHRFCVATGDKDTTLFLCVALSWNYCFNQIYSISLEVSITLSSFLYIAYVALDEI
jgi:hypothetical protein